MDARVFAIGDIHGSLRALRELLSWLGPGEGDHLIFLGDYVDRGPDSKGVIDDLLALRNTTSATFIRGNHEEMMLLARRDPSSYRAWLSVGGDAALASYGPDSRLDGVPATHWSFMEQTKSWHETDSHLLVHAPVRPDRPVARQTSYEWRWRFDLPDRAHESGKTVVCGHATQGDGVPMMLHRMCFIDTGAWFGGWLTALDLKEHTAYQTSQDGSRRVLTSEEFRTGPVRAPA